MFKFIVLRNNCLTSFVNADSSTTIGSRGFAIRIFITFYVITHITYSIGELMPGKGYNPKKGMKKNTTRKTRKKR